MLAFRMYLVRILTLISINCSFSAVNTAIVRAKKLSIEYRKQQLLVCSMFSLKTDSYT